MTARKTKFSQRLRKEPEGRRAHKALQADQTSETFPLQHTQLNSRQFSPINFLQLQRTVGNQAVQRLKAEVRGVVQRQEIDTSSSPSLPDYEKGEVPFWKEDRDLPEWAKEEYKRESKRTVIASMTSDGKIGSVYFDTGRIRTTHSHGPEKEIHGDETVLQFNVDEGLAIPDFERTFAGDDADYWDSFDVWLKDRLKNSTVDHLPPWAKSISNPEAAYDISGSNPPENVKLFEIFKKINGNVEGWHPSRGTAVKYETNKQVISVLNAAIKHINSKKSVDPKERNRQFYEFVKNRLPGSEIVKSIRDPATFKVNPLL